MFNKTWTLIKIYYFKLISSGGTPHSIALGVAIGFFAGTAIPLGQVILALVLAFIFRANKILAVGVTFITNPYTTPFIYTFLCWLGAKILGMQFTFAEIQDAFKGLVYSFNPDALLHLGNKLIGAYLTGGVIFGSFSGLLSYFISKKLVVLYRKRNRY